MPGLDGTGPRGRGPMTGWGNGYCAVRISSPQQEIEYLKRQSMALRRQLSIIRARMDELSTGKGGASCQGLMGLDQEEWDR